jgi:hypothetical protein
VLVGALAGMSSGVDAVTMYRRPLPFAAATAFLLLLIYLFRDALRPPSARKAACSDRGGDRRPALDAGGAAERARSCRSGKRGSSRQRVRSAPQAAPGIATSCQCAGAGDRGGYRRRRRHHRRSTCRSWAGFRRLSDLGRVLFDARTISTSRRTGRIPGAAIFLTVLSINFIGDWLRGVIRGA